MFNTIIKLSCLVHYELIKRLFENFLPCYIGSQKSAGGLLQWPTLRGKGDT